MEQLVYPHDLLTITLEKDELSSFPEWAQLKLTEFQTVIVTRQKPLSKNKIVVGVRGNQRNQRFAFEINKQRIQKRVTPYEALEQFKFNRLPESRKGFPVFQALRSIQGKHFLSADFGITGSAGYEIVTGDMMVKETSDLDLVLKVDHQISFDKLKKLWENLNQFSVHADVQLVNDDRGFSLEEFVQQNGKQVLMKSGTGPFISNCPWSDLIQGKHC
ncbi:hypothetical protein A3O17_06105 [Ligilactobacillus aviarius]|uniref:malonate decarboxylase holo-ACP synthase n=1 Tax=Ligilactobacillus aviarius TaxID=1606 RepID=UPI0007DA1D75|nr:malonate decarboxylase holo-ACP synthase [Ligilactobacillus aviarius]OAQ07887.1 hypothetical protein A3O15_05830 [Ligilactobacillus aviarius]OAS76024.1 hypothetical protein A3O17_06105 [Ligilactobacillus aviarius]